MGENPIFGLSDRNMVPRLRGEHIQLHPIIASLQLEHRILKGTSATGVNSGVVASLKNDPPAVFSEKGEELVYLKLVYLIG